MGIPINSYKDRCDLCDEILDFIEAAYEVDGENPTESKVRKWIEKQDFWIYSEDDINEVIKDLMHQGAIEDG